MMPVETQVPNDHPIMPPWKKYQKTDEFANTLKWCGKDPRGTIWAAFMAGWNAAIDRNTDEHCVEDPRPIISTEDVRWVLSERWRCNIPELPQETLIRLLGISIGLCDLHGDDGRAEHHWVGTGRKILGGECPPRS